MFGWFNEKPLEDINNPNKAVEAFRGGRFTEALKRARAIIEFEPKVALSHRFLGEVLFEMENYAECESVFEEAEKLGGPGTEECFLWRALSMANDSRKEEGMLVLAQYIKSENSNPLLAEKCNQAIDAIKNMP